MGTILTTLITNEDKSILDALAITLPSLYSIENCVGYFFFLSVQMMPEQLKDKKIGILVGLAVDSKLISNLNKNFHYQDVSFNMHAFRPPTYSALQLKQNYLRETTYGLPDGPPEPKGSRPA